MADEAIQVVVERPARYAEAPAPIGVADERRVAGQGLGAGELPTRTRPVVDRDHHPPEEPTDRVGAGIPALRMTAAAQQRRRRGECRDHRLIDHRGVEMATEGQVLVRYAESIDQPDHAPGDRPPSGAWAVMGERPPLPRPSSLTQ